MDIYYFMIILTHVKINLFYRNKDKLKRNRRKQNKNRKREVVILT